MPKLSIIIVNWNSGPQLRACLTSIAAAGKGGLDLLPVVVVDNASSDTSLEGIENLGVSVHIVRNSRNRGFAAACNQGAAESRADYLLFLNPDTILYPASLASPVEFMERHENLDIGIVGIQLVDDAGEVSRTCARFPTVSGIFARMIGLDRLLPARFPSHFISEWDHSASRYVDEVIGAFFLVRHSYFEILGGFDERFFVYFEELDFSLRARQSGWRSFYLADARAYHKGGGTSEQVKAMRLFYFLRSRILYGYKHFGRLTATALTIGTLLLEPLPRLFVGAARCSGKDIAETLLGYLCLWRDIPVILKTALTGDRSP